MLRVEGVGIWSIRGFQGFVEVILVGILCLRGEEMLGLLGAGMEGLLKGWEFHHHLDILPGSEVFGLGDGGNGRTWSLGGLGDGLDELAGTGVGLGLE